MFAMNSMIKLGMLSRGAAALLATAGLALAGCSANGGPGSSSGSSGSGPTVNLTASGVFNPGVPFTLTWTSSDPNATCTAGGGGAGDGWSGTEPASGSAQITESITGTYTYTLSCADASGTGVGTTSVNVVPAGSSSSSGASSSGASSSGASSSGASSSGASSSGVSSSGASSSGASSSGASSSGASSSSGGSSSGGVSIKLVPNQVAPGNSFNLIYTGPVSPSGSTICTASNTAGDSGWSGTVANTGGTQTLTAPVKANIYAYTISCSTGTGAAQAATAYLYDGVPIPVPTDCGVSDNFGNPVPTVDLLAPDASVTTSNGGICVACSVSQPENVVDQDPTDYATLNTPVGIAADVALTVTSAASTYSAGHLVGFVASSPAQLLTLDLLKSVTINTFLNGVEQDSAGATSTSPLGLDLLTVLANSKSAFVGFVATKPFNAVQVADGNLVSAIGQLNVYQACVSTATFSGSSSSSGGSSSSSSSSSGSGSSSSSSSSSGSSSSSSGSSSPAAAVSIRLSPNPVQPGANFTLTYTGPGASSSSCTATNTAADPNWSAAVTGTGGSITLTAPATKNIYAYGISCSVNTGGTSSATVELFDGIPTPVATDCGVTDNLGVAVPTLNLTSTNASESTGSGGLCLACSISQPQNVTNQDTSNYAVMNTPVGIVASESLTVSNNTPFTAGHIAGFIAANPGELLTLTLLQNLTVNTLLGGAVQETAGTSSSSPTQLDLLTVLSNPTQSFLGFKTSKAFDALQLVDGSTVSLIGQVDIYQACVSTP